jgi:hypothetical protein
VNQLILDAGGTASSVIDAMIQGLRNIPEGFVVSMGTYGIFEGNICFGCAATCAVMQISGVTFTPETISGFAKRAAVTGYSPEDITDFENAINWLREGYLGALEDLLGVSLPKPSIALPRLQTSTWEQNLWAYEAYRDQLKEAGL